MNTEDRDKKVDSIFTLVTDALTSRLKSDEVNDKDIAVALKFLGIYEAERLPIPGANTGEASDLPYPRAARG